MLAAVLGLPALVVRAGADLLAEIDPVAGVSGFAPDLKAVFAVREAAARHDRH